MTDEQFNQMKDSDTVRVSVRAVRNQMAYTKELCKRAEMWKKWSDRWAAAWIITWTLGWLAFATNVLVNDLVSKM